MALCRNKFVSPTHSLEPGAAKRQCSVSLSTHAPLSDNSSFHEYQNLLTDKMVYLTKSRIHHIGMFAAKSFHIHQMVIEYMGEVLESNLRRIIENKYDQQKRRIYTIR